ncbi:MAG: hypothetical protein KC478_13165 [Bacteriovoracaceae bacterium]|nr:hypothetical protein [Bacteriovoracaceae bacterium]
MKTLLIGLALLISMSSFAAGTLTCSVAVEGKYVEGSQVTKEITKKSSLINKIGEDYAYFADVTAEGGFGDVTVVDKVTGFKAQSSDISSGFVSRVGEDTEIEVELKNKHGGILGDKEIKSLKVNCNINY